MEVTQTELRKALARSVALNDGTMFHIGAGSFGWHAKLERFGLSYKATVWNDDHGLAIVEENRFATDERAVTILAHNIANTYRYHFWPANPSVSIREWYTATCPTDELGQKLEDEPFYMYFAHVAKRGSWYVDGVDDSIVRQRLQDAMDHVMHGIKADIYDITEE